MEHLGKYKVLRLDFTLIESADMETFMDCFSSMISDRDAFENCRLLAKLEGIIAGESSGAAMAAVRKLAERIGKGNIVTIFPDRGDRYFSKHLFD